MRRPPSQYLRNLWVAVNGCVALHYKPSSLSHIHTVYTTALQ
jgi:hypothetical protein